MESFNEIIKRLRKEQRLTLEELATKSGLTTLNISRLENGKQRPKPNTIYKLSRALNYDYSKLFNASLIKK